MAPQLPQQPDEGGGASLKGNIATGALLVFGTAAAVLTKAAYGLEGVGADGLVSHFEKPWTLTAVMFAGMATCLPIAYYDKVTERRAAAAGGSSGDEGEEQGEGLGATLAQVFDAEEARDAALLAAPALLDLAATGAQYFGLTVITASAYQMLRGAMLVSAAGMGVAFLRRRLNAAHLGGIAATLAGLGLVGAASVLSGDGSLTRDVPQSEVLVGLAACVIGQCLQAAQVTVEDALLSGPRRVPPLKVVGYEGLLGGVATLALVLPLLAALPGDGGALAGLREDTGDTLAMIASNPTIAAVLLADCVAFAGLNVAGMVVIAEHGAVYKTLMDTARTLCVWLVGLGLFYTGVGGGVVGESWNAYSPLQLAGFALVVAGTVAYSSGTKAEEPGAQQQAAGTSATTPLLMDVDGMADGRMHSPALATALAEASSADAAPDAAPGDAAQRSVAGESRAAWPDGPSCPLPRAAAGAARSGGHATLQQLQAPRRNPGGVKTRGRHVARGAHCAAVRHRAGACAGVRRSLGLRAC